MKKFILYISLLLLSVSLFAQETKEVVYDTDAIELKKFDQQKITEYKQQDEFIYTIQEREPGILDAIWDWFKRVIKNILSYFFDDIGPAVGVLSSILRVLPYIIAGIVLYLLIKFFLKVNARNIVSGKGKSPIVSFSEEEVLIRDKDLPKLIKEAIHNKNYQLAVRYYYLLVLKNLVEKEIIVWQQEKTNEDYIKEMHQKPRLYADFKVITYLYDYVWYGDFEIPETDFFTTEKQFKDFITKIG